MGIAAKFKIESTLPPLPHSPRAEASRTRSPGGSHTNTVRFNSSMTPKAVSPPATPGPETPAAVEA